MLFSATGSDARGDESLLPFYGLKLEAFDALLSGDGAEKRAKASLMAAYQQMRRSPDVTSAEAARLFDAWVTEFHDEKARLERVRAMPTTPRLQEPDELTRDLANAAVRLQL